MVNAGDGVSYEEFARVALDEGKYEAEKLETINQDSLNRAAPRPRNSRLKCLFSEALGLRALPFWEEGLKDFVVADKAGQR